jgi:gamma-glutamyl hercynylcysteine S-oxide synthase
VAHPVLGRRLDRQSALHWYRRNRERSANIFDMIADDVYYERPIALRNPIVFYEGHLPAFSVNTLVKKGLGGRGVDDWLETLFARGIDPDSASRAVPRVQATWPTREAVREYGRAADRVVEKAITEERFERPGVPVLDRGEGLFTILEHEAMHQETLLYIWHRLPLDDKRRPAGYTPETGGTPADRAFVRIPAGGATLGADRDELRFGWDNEFEAHHVEVPAFAIERNNVTNAAYLEFVADRGYERQDLWREAGWRWRVAEGVAHPLFWERHAGEWYWRGQFDLVPLPLSWPVYVTHAEASAYARWRDARLPTEAEYHRAAFGTPEGPERQFPWGDDEPDGSRGNFDFASWDPVPAGSRPAGASAWGVHDLVGNGWEWTDTVFAPFGGFAPMPSYPEYSVEFFDGEHYVLKGASPVTARELVRRSFRNWFRPQYPYVYAAFRCARS